MWELSHVDLFIWLELDDLLTVLVYKFLNSRILKTFITLHEMCAAIAHVYSCVNLLKNILIYPFFWLCSFIICVIKSKDLKNIKLFRIYFFLTSVFLSIGHWRPLLHAYFIQKIWKNCQESDQRFSVSLKILKFKT